MPIPWPSSRKHLSTYIMPSSSREDEEEYLQLRDNLLISGMGEALPEQFAPVPLHHVLDIGCNAGGWLLTVARDYPEITQLVGLNLSQQMIKYARSQAEAQQVSDRVTFHAMNIIDTLEFPNNYFDLVHLQFGQSYLRTWDWTILLQEIKRVTRPGGRICVTDMNFFEGDSSALKLHAELVEQTLYRAGYRFNLNRDCMRDLVPLLQRHNLHQIQTQQFRLAFPASTPEGGLFAQKIAYGSRYIKPFLRKWTRMPDDYDRQCQQLLDEMQHPDFVTFWPIFRVWCTVQ